MCPLQVPLQQISPSPLTPSPPHSLVLSTNPLPVFVLKGFVSRGQAGLQHVTLTSSHQAQLPHSRHDLHRKAYFFFFTSANVSLPRDLSYPPRNNYVIITLTFIQVCYRHSLIEGGVLL